MDKASSRIKKMLFGGGVKGESTTAMGVIKKNGSFVGLAGGMVVLTKNTGDVLKVESISGTRQTATVTFEGGEVVKIPAGEVTWMKIDGHSVCVLNQLFVYDVKTPTHTVTCVCNLGWDGQNEELYLMYPDMAKIKRSTVLGLEFIKWRGGRETFPDYAENSTAFDDFEFNSDLQRGNMEKEMSFEMPRTAPAYSRAPYDEDAEDKRRKKALDDYLGVEEEEEPEVVEQPKQKPQTGVGIGEAPDSGKGKSESLPDLVMTVIEPEPTKEKTPVPEEEGDTKIILAFTGGITYEELREECKKYKWVPPPEVKKPMGFSF